ncbi:hypothetical protein BBK36DRAFT_1168655 [Trichoderma citrinoviride]|uniref:BTB domain-containing protein n=1 Tax=Trichoderma citrinoviride TaxID=58853 RepID=A0A2T4BCU9_9HYPO|nr:hypothetical protein BBK36DRAFT_1168655 [Trichoderma citrinoviride]PTB67160.1 hypothetical protein BBK36DRAFT_1168655 [Trichoderma citrinoviride]
MASAAEIRDSVTTIAHPVLGQKSQQQFVIRSTFSWLPVLSVGRHLLTLPLFCTVVLLQLAVLLAIVKNGLARNSCPEMAKTKPTSLDGRSQKLSKPAWKPKEEPGPSLKPASPPRENPWHRRSSAPAGPDDKQPLKSLRRPLAEEEFPELKTGDGAADDALPSEEAQREPSPSCNVSKSSCSTIETHSDETRSAVSRLSTPTRLILEEAADQAAKILWRHPFGSNVYLYVETSVFQLHRDILMRHSGWFRDKLPPPNQNGSPVEIHLPHAIGAVQPCLFFMYTKNLDICERSICQPLNFIHIPRCVLAYCAAVNFQIPTMASRILGILEETAKDLAAYLNSYFIYREMDFKTSKSMATYFVNSLDILYSEPLFELMKPIRQALAGILDALLPSLLRQPYFPEMLCMPGWKRWSAAIAADQVEYRAALGHGPSATESVLPTETELEALFDRVLGKTGESKEKKKDTAESPSKKARKGAPSDGGEQDKASTTSSRSRRRKKKADSKDLSNDRVPRAASAVGSTGSEAGTWNSLGADDSRAGLERPSPTTSCSLTHGKASAGRGRRLNPSPAKSTRS